MARAFLRELAEIVRLDTGRHRSPQDGVCTMELVAWMAGEKHSDHPRSASPVVAAAIRSFNDALDSSHRQRLAPLAERLIGTRAGRAEEVLRGQMLWDWMITTAVPGWLVAAERPDIAALVTAGRAAALPAAMAAIDVYGHAMVRPVDDDRVAATVGEALALSGLTGACVAGRNTADGVRESRARRHWDAARTLARAAAWSVATAPSEVGAGDGRAALWQTAWRLRDSTFALLDRLIAVTEDVVPVGATDAESAAPAAELTPV